MIPGPIEISPAVAEAAAARPPSHTSPGLIAAFGGALQAMRAIWGAPDGQPFVLAGSGTLAMEMAVTNLLEPGKRALVLNTGYFSDRMASMLERRGVQVMQVRARPGDTVGAAAVKAALETHRVDALFATHVDTSTGVRVDAAGIAEAARPHEVLVVFDGVCATAGEAFAQAALGVDVYLTASQKALGLPPGLALLVASPRALAARERLAAPPPLSMDWLQWLPIMRAYEEGRPSYFATPATSLVQALAVGLAEILEIGAETYVARHTRVAAAMRAAWAELGLDLLPTSSAHAANTLSAIRYPAGVGPTLPAKIAAHGVLVAGGLHPEIKNDYFRVGHMGFVTGQPELLVRTVEAVGRALAEEGHVTDVERAARSLSDAVARF